MPDRAARQHRWAQRLLAERDLRARPYRPADRPAIERIVLGTGLRGRPSRDFFEDDEVILRLFLAYYLDHEPDACVVTEIDGQLCGYILGCCDTNRYERYVLKVAPRVVGRIVAGVVGLRLRHSQSYRTLWWLVSRAYREAPPVDLDLYPGHVHVGIDLGVLGPVAPLAWFPVWATAWESLEQVFRARRVRGVHGHVAEPLAQRAITRRMRLYGWRLLEERRLSLFSQLTGEPYMLRAVGKDLSDPAPE